MSTDIKQGTPEWLKARVGKITGSRVGAILGKSPFTSRKKVMREMADEMLGNFHDFDAPPLRYGRDNEPVAAKLYEFLYAGTDTVSETGFWEKGDLGASPDRLVGDDGLVEIKCPYGKRDDVAPEYVSIFDASMKHYYHQVQMQLHVTNRHWCDFFQWSEHGQLNERVERDLGWYQAYEDEFVCFMGELDDLLKKVAKGGSEERVSMSARWAALAEAYHLASNERARIDKELKDAKQGMVDLMQASEIDHCRGSGIFIQKIDKRGSVDYKEMLIAEMGGEKPTADAEDAFRRKGSSSWTIKETDDE